MDPLDRIDQIIAFVEGARPCPMSRTNCMVDRGEMIALLDETARRPARRAAQGGRAAGGARQDHRRRPARGRADHQRGARRSTPGWSRSTRSSSPPSTRPPGWSAEARAEAQRLREEVDDFVDTALANFEQFLTRSLASIERGRDKMHALREIGSFSSGEEDDRPLPF